MLFVKSVQNSIKNLFSSTEELTWEQCRQNTTKNPHSLIWCRLVASLSSSSITKSAWILILESNCYHPAGTAGNEQSRSYFSVLSTLFKDDQERRWCIFFKINNIAIWRLENWFIWKKTYEMYYKHSGQYKNICLFDI